MNEIYYFPLPVKSALCCISSYILSVFFFFHMEANPNYLPREKLVSNPKSSFDFQLSIGDKIQLVGGEHKRWEEWSFAGETRRQAAV